VETNQLVTTEPLLSKWLWLRDLRPEITHNNTEMSHGNELEGGKFCSVTEGRHPNERPWIIIQQRAWMASPNLNSLSNGSILFPLFHSCLHYIFFILYKLKYSILNEDHPTCSTLFKPVDYNCNHHPAHVFINQKGKKPILKLYQISHQIKLYGSSSWPSVEIYFKTFVEVTFLIFAFSFPRTPKCFKNKIIK
jgi:hypothetical protein